ncbi:MAG: energy transducer TonB [Candidatus Latescibacteria bacterium]|nr:energy transducer TonB [Candidatus Latescibacterota bacterium]
MAHIGRFFANRYTLAYGAALAAHLLFFVFYVPLSSLVPQPRNDVPVHDSSPMSFEFVELPHTVPDEQPPETTPLRADRVSRAKDLHDADLPESHLPYNDGLVQSPSQLRTEIGREGERGERGEADSGAEVDPSRRADAEDEAVSTDSAPLLKQRNAWSPEPSKRAFFGRPDAPGVIPLKNLQSHALEQGGLQLSTYDWEFAPYLAYLKRHIGDHIHPPAAFTQLGLIQGTTRLKFRIMPDGSLENLAVIDFDGSPYLRDTSTRAVELSADFKPLPTHFPDDYLEISAFFHYLILDSP